MKRWMPRTAQLYVAIACVLLGSIGDRCLAQQVVPAQPQAVLQPAIVNGQAIQLFLNVDEAAKVPIGALAPVRIVLPVDGQQVNSRDHAYRFMRGLIQNELSIIDQICELQKDQKQKLVDLAEDQWKEKTKPSIDKCIQQHLWGNIDLDGLAERLVRNWLASSSSREQLERYDAELADRMLYRKQALLSRWLDVQQTKLNLSAKQMKEIEKVLNENWRDRWFRSLEATFSNSSLLPDIKTIWISPLLSDAQNAALVARDTQAMYRSFTLSSDCPTKELSERFSVGAVTSSEKIELSPKSSNEPVLINGLEELNDGSKP
jgi:hypothetical protein